MNHSVTKRDVEVTITLSEKEFATLVNCMRLAFYRRDVAPGGDIAVLHTSIVAIAEANGIDWPTRYIQPFIGNERVGFKYS